MSNIHSPEVNNCGAPPAASVQTLMYTTHYRSRFAAPYFVRICSGYFSSCNLDDKTRGYWES